MAFVIHTYIHTHTHWVRHLRSGVFSKSNGIGLATWFPFKWRRVRRSVPGRHTVWFPCESVHRLPIYPDTTIERFVPFTTNVKSGSLFLPTHLDHITLDLMCGQQMPLCYICLNRMHWSTHFWHQRWGLFWFPRILAGRFEDRGLFSCIRGGSVIIVWQPSIAAVPALSIGECVERLWS